MQKWRNAGWDVAADSAFAGHALRGPGAAATSTVMTHSKQRSGAASAGAVIMVLVLAALGGCARQESATPATTEAAKPVAPTREQLLGATVTGVFDAAVTLTAGRYEGPSVEAGAASKPTLKLWDSTIEFVDLDGVPPAEGIALLTAGEGGTGTYSHLGVFSVQEGRAATLGVLPLGDRVQLFRLWHEPGKVLLDLVEPGPGDPACCPTHLSRKAFGWKDGKLQQLSSDVVGGLSINLLAATDWMLVEMDGRPLPAGGLPPTTLVQYGKAAGFAGCNRYTGPITESAPGTVKLGELAVTRKACDAAAQEMEAAFLDRMRATTSYAFQAGQLLLVAPQDGESPRTLLFSR
jgi:heat shock protein HslJ